MKRIVKIGIVIVAIVCVSVVTAVVMLNVKQPLSLINMESTFEGIYVEVITDKDVYSAGENVKIGVILKNKNTNDTTLYCSGWKNETTGEFLSYFHVSVYTDFYEKIWDFGNPGKYDVGWWPAQYNITINGSSNITFTNICNWNQTAKNIWLKMDDKVYEPNKQVPSGTYIVVVTVPIQRSHYFEPPYAYAPFGNSKMIVIE